MSLGNGSSSSTFSPSAPAIEVPSPATRIRYYKDTDVPMPESDQDMSPYKPSNDDEQLEMEGTTTMVHLDYPLYPSAPPGGPQVAGYPNNYPLAPPQAQSSNGMNTQPGQYNDASAPPLENLNLTDYPVHPDVLGYDDDGITTNFAADDNAEEGAVDEGVNSYRRTYGESVVLDNGYVPGGGDAMMKNKKKEEEIEDGWVECEGDDRVAAREETIEGTLRFSMDGVNYVPVAKVGNIKNAVLFFRI